MLPMSSISWNNIPVSDLFGALVENERIWKKRIGRAWPPESPIELIMHVAVHMKLVQTTKYSAVSLLHTHMARTKIETTKLSLVAVTCLFVVSKKHEREPLQIHTLLGFCKERFTRKDVLRCEKEILKAVDFDLCLPHVGEFTELYLHFYFQNKTVLHDLVYKVQDLLYSAPNAYLNVEYSLLSVSLICAAVSINMLKPSITALEWAQNASKNERSEIMSLANKIIKFAVDGLESGISYKLCYRDGYGKYKEDGYARTNRKSLSKISSC